MAADEPAEDERLVDTWLDWLVVAVWDDVGTSELDTAGELVPDDPKLDVASDDDGDADGDTDADDDDGATELDAIDEDGTGDELARLDDGWLDASVDDPLVELCELDSGQLDGHPTRRLYGVS